MNSPSKAVKRAIKGDFKKSDSRISEVSAPVDCESRIKRRKSVETTPPMPAFSQALLFVRFSRVSSLPW
jgi:hypothetical protein